MSYLEDVKMDIMELIKGNSYCEINLMESINDENFKDAFNDAFRNTVTGNDNGSYFCDRQQAFNFYRENGGATVVKEAMDEGFTTPEVVASDYLEDNWEDLDLVAREFVFGDALTAAISELKGEN